MAKTTTCAFCGKEIKKGLFKGENFYFEAGQGHIVNCCSECYDKRIDEEKSNKERFGVKLKNFKRATKYKMSESEIAQMYDKYLEEKSQQISKYGTEEPEKIIGCFCFNLKGNFTVREFSMAFENTDVSPKDMVKSLEKATRTQAFYFDKNDITKIEYAKIGMGSFLGLFAKAYSFAIRLNDETVITYKPCITRTAVLGRGFFLGYQRSAEKQLMIQLETFKKIIGSDLPIVKVNKI